MSKTAITSPQNLQQQLQRNWQQHLQNWFSQGWLLMVAAIALILSLPTLAVLSSIFSNQAETWDHLAATVLPAYVGNSLSLMAGVSGGVLIIGVGTAWLVTKCRFPGDRLFEWALLLPLAAPTYILAYTYTDLLDVSGVVQTSLRKAFDWQVGDYWFPDIRSLPGAIALLSLTLYPYVYLLARVAFLEQSAGVLEASRLLGCSPWRSFWQISLPLARPAIVAGLSLALMETLNDFGTVEYFGVSTFTTGIYRTWFGLGEPVAAAQLAACLLLFILWLILGERWSRRQVKFYQTSSYYSLPSYELRGGRGGLAMFACAVPIIFGLLIPAGDLGLMTLRSPDQILGNQFWNFATNSFTLATITALIALGLGLVIAYGVRLANTAPIRFVSQITALGYAVPGSVIAVGTLIPLGWVDNTIDTWFRDNWQISTGLLFSGTIFALVFGYLVRFLAVSLGGITTSLEKIKPNLDNAARSLGHQPLAILGKVHMPLLWSSLMTAGILVFVDVMKELPATIILRPFNFNTLAVRVYNLASDERLSEAASSALAIVLVGLIPVLILTWQIRNSRSLPKV